MAKAKPPLCIHPRDQIDPPGHLGLHWCRACMDWLTIEQFTVVVARVDNPNWGSF